MVSKDTQPAAHRFRREGCHLIRREAERLKKWEVASLCAKVQQACAAAQKFAQHDEPPFANGDVHIGTALNKILKESSTHTICHRATTRDK
jgi:isoleucyl-tRNA synthetase